MNSSPRQILFILFIFLQANTFSQNLDIDLLRSVNKRETSFKNSFFKADAQSVTVFNIAAPAAVFMAGLLKHNKALKKDAVFMAGSFLLSTIITQATKQIVKRTRPFDKYSFIIKRDEGGGYSFPSGHTSAAFTTATSVSLFFPKWYVIVPSYLWASSVAYARLYQGVHYPSDVLAGALIGAGSAWLGWKAQKWISGKKEQKKKVTL